MNPISPPLRLLREQLNFSILEVAEATGLSSRTILRAEQGEPLNPKTRQLLCQFYSKTPEELGLIPRRHRKGVGTPDQSSWLRLADLSDAK